MGTLQWVYQGGHKTTDKHWSLFISKVTIIWHLRFCSPKVFIFPSLLPLPYPILVATHLTCHFFLTFFTSSMSSDFNKNHLVWNTHRSLTQTKISISHPLSPVRLRMMSWKVQEHHCRKRVKANDKKKTAGSRNCNHNPATVSYGDCRNVNLW